LSIIVSLTKPVNYLNDLLNATTVKNSRHIFTLIKKNKKMKSKITLFVMLMFVGILSTQAQPGQRRTPEERTKMTVDRLVDSIKISTVQQTDVTAAYLEYYNAQDKLRAGLVPGTRPERADMDKLTEARDAKLKIILTEGQFTKLKEMEAAMRNRQRPPGQ
jgi:hypothetical protein